MTTLDELLDGHFALLRLGDEEIAGDFILIHDSRLQAFVDRGAGVVVPWRAVTAAFVTVEPEEAEPAIGARHKVSIEGAPGGWTATCTCGGWTERGEDKSPLLDAAEVHLAAQRKR